MCTVTIVPKGGTDFILTSNRDEAPNRKTLAPDFYTTNHIKLLFPKDEVSGGTWIGVSEKHRLVCVLNGAFVKHKRKPNYSKSRGVVAKDVMTFNNVVFGVEAYNFEGIEPFTIIIADWSETLKFYELVWDGKQKYFTSLPLEPRLWSSSTLYNTEMKQERQQWFKNFKSEHELNHKTLLHFHETAGADNMNYGVIMDRGIVKTTSITQVDKNGTAVTMHYKNLKDNTLTTKTYICQEFINE